VLHARYSWQPLGELLVAKGLLTKPELEAALTEQKRSGRLVGEILVESGVLSAFSLTRALTEQHGVELQTGSEDELGGTGAQAPTVWRPLGKLLVEQGYLTKLELRRALERQRESKGRRLLGEILVAEGYLSGIALARALGEQNGIALDDAAELDVETVVKTADAGQVVFQVFEVAYAPRYKPHEVIYESPSFMEAVDFAAEFIEDANPDGIEIQRTEDGRRETVWTYSDSRAAATARTRKDLTETFGFDPTLWGTAAAG
jgi:hypothetical protein